MKRLMCSLVAVAALMLFVGSCGKDDGQGLPLVDTVPPNPPVGIDIQCQGTTVTITWDENPEVDLAGYRIYKSSHEAGPYGVINSRLRMCPWWEDEVLPMTMTYYKLTAVDETGNESAFSELSGVYTNTGGRDQPDAPVEH